MFFPFLATVKGTVGMTYQLFYGDGAAMVGHDPREGERVCREHYSTEHEALNRARELVEQDDGIVVAIRDTAGNLLSGVLLHLKLARCYE